MNTISNCKLQSLPEAIVGLINKLHFALQFANKCMYLFRSYVLKHKHDISQQIISEFETIARRSVFVRFPKEYHVIALPDSNSDGHADIADTSTRPAGQVHDSSRGGQCLKNHQV